MEAKFRTVLSLGVMLMPVAGCTGGEPGVEDIRAALKHDPAFMHELQRVLDWESAGAGFGGEAAERIGEITILTRGKCKPAGDSFDCEFGYIRDHRCPSADEGGTDEAEGMAVAERRPECEPWSGIWTVGHFRQGLTGWQVELPE